MDKPSVSIIVPHFNTPDSLEHLIQSIPMREDFEVIVVDDNSTNVTVEQLQERLQKYTSVAVYRNDSGIKGAGASRNVGLSHATGEWLLFADADDFFTEQFEEKVTAYLSSEYDMVYFPPTSMDVVTGQPSSRHVMYSELVHAYHDKATERNLTEMKYLFCTPWSKLIRRSVFEKNGIQFDPVMVSNDIMAMTKSAYYSQKVGTCADVIYCVTRGGKTLTSKKNDANFDMRIDVLIRRYTFLRDHLEKKQFKYAHIDRLALGKLVDVVIEHWGIRKFFEILHKYHKAGVHYFDIGLLNPVTVWHKAKIELAWWADIKKHRAPDERK